MRKVRRRARCEESLGRRLRIILILDPEWDLNDHPTDPNPKPVIFRIPAPGIWIRAEAPCPQTFGLYLGVVHIIYYEDFFS